MLDVDNRYLSKVLPSRFRSERVKMILTKISVNMSVRISLLISHDFSPITYKFYVAKIRFCELLCETKLLKAFHMGHNQLTLQHTMAMMLSCRDHTGNLAANKRTADHQAKVLVNTLAKFGKINIYKSRYYIDTGYWLRCHL